MAALRHRKCIRMPWILPIVLSQKSVQDDRLLRHEMRSHTHRTEAKRRGNRRSDIGPDCRSGSARLMQLEHALVGATIDFVVAICATLFLLWKLHLDLLLATTVLHHHHAPFALWLLLIHHLFFRVVGDRFLLFSTSAAVSSLDLKRSACSL